MNLKNLNYKKIISIFLSGIVLINITGCSKKIKQERINEETKYIESYEPNEIQEPNETQESTEPIKENQENKNIENNQIKYSKEDLETIKKFNEIYESIDTKKEKFEENCKLTFINIVDFIFYDKEINGIKFNDLTSEGKLKILEICNKIDNKIESKIPNYKENITNSSKKAFNKASDLIKKGINNLNLISKEKLGEENYNEIINAKNEFINNLMNSIETIKENGKEYMEKGKQKIKNWYEEFKKRQD